jgi:hypothetical protein
MRRRNGYLFRIAGLVGDVVRARIVLPSLRRIRNSVAWLGTSLLWRLRNVYAGVPMTYHSLPAARRVIDLSVAPFTLAVPLWSWSSACFS